MARKSKKGGAEATAITKLPQQHYITDVPNFISIYWDENLFEAILAAYKNKGKEDYIHSNNEGFFSTSYAYEDSGDTDYAWSVRIAPNSAKLTRHHVLFLVYVLGVFYEYNTLSSKNTPIEERFKKLVTELDIDVERFLILRGKSKEGLSEAKWQSIVRDARNYLLRGKVFEGISVSLATQQRARKLPSNALREYKNRCKEIRKENKRASEDKLQSLYDKAENEIGDEFPCFNDCCDSLASYMESYSWNGIGLTIGDGDSRLLAKHLILCNYIKIPKALFRVDDTAIGHSTFFIGLKLIAYSVLSKNYAQKGILLETLREWSLIPELDAKVKSRSSRKLVFEPMAHCLQNLQDLGLFEQLVITDRLGNQLSIEETAKVKNAAAWKKLKLKCVLKDITDSS